MASVRGDDVRAVAELELSLLDPAVRRSARDLERLLAPDFTEVGASGRWWTRTGMMAALTAEAGERPVPAVSEMSGRAVGPDLVLLHFVTESEGRRVRRSSLWRRTRGRWQIVHHQGTPIPGTPIAPDASPASGVTALI